MPPFAVAASTVTNMHESPSVPPLPTLPIGRRWAALGGLAAGALAVTVGMLIAAITEVVSPIDAVGSEVIDRSPGWLKEWAIQTFGTDDKLVLRIGIVVVMALAALALGATTRTRRWVGPVGVSLFGVVGALAAVGRPDESIGAALPQIVGSIVGIIAITRLTAPRPMQVPGGTLEGSAASRRRLLAATGGTALAAVTAGGIAKALDSRQLDDFTEQTRRPLPEAPELDPAPSLPTDSTVPMPDTDIGQLSPFITPNDEFYRIDTVLSFPRITTAEWSLTIDGMVDRPRTITWDELMAMPQVERVITLTCVSNEVGGRLVGNAVWRGVLLRDILDPVGVQPEAQQILSSSADGWSCGFPVSAAFDGRDAMVAFGMNGEPLPLANGFPARLVVPGLYGYVSATKWVRRIKVTTWDERGYWIDLGWALEAPVKTQSRIDVPRNEAVVAAGTLRAAGVAWAQHRGIERVQIRLDGGEWQDATLSDDVSDDAWRQWWIDLELERGEYAMEVRATDKTGYVQPETRTSVAPNGADGYHRRWIIVS